jgi:rsbT co-antagonist protein RsbR
VITLNEQVNQTNYKIEISEKILARKQELIKQKSTISVNQLTQTIDTQLHQWRENIIEIYANSIASDLETAYTDLKNWGQEAVNTLVNYNLPLEIALDEVREYRNLIGRIIKDEAIQYHLGIDAFYTILSEFDSVVDKAVHWLSISYTKTFYTRINAAEATALELSIPIIKISDKVGVLPLVGDIDTQRARHLMDKALTKGSELSIEHLIIDLSGVPIIDTMVADRIFKVIDSLNLIGIKATLTGVRPETAQIMVQLGINVSSIPVASNLQTALKKTLSTIEL